MISFLFSLILGPLMFFLIGFGVGYYYFGNKDQVNARIKAKAQEEFDKLVAAAGERLSSTTTQTTNQTTNQDDIKA